MSDEDIEALGLLLEVAASMVGRSCTGDIEVWIDPATWDRIQAWSKEQPESR